MWARKAKESVSIPVIASLNAVNRETWLTYAKELADTGVDALELNFYASPRSFEATSESIESEQIGIVEEVKRACSLPVSVKLSPFYTNPLRLIKEMDEAGADGFVLFNRLFQPDIDVASEKNVFPIGFSGASESGMALRYAGLLNGNVKASICSSTGISGAEDVLKMVLAGADCVQIVSALYRNGIDSIKSMLDGMAQWLDDRGHASLENIRGSMSRKRSKDPWIFTRAQYVKLLMQAGEKIFKELG
jgi:dihydroorotate dehydrogenase (fumarate)